MPPPHNLSLYKKKCSLEVAMSQFDILMHQEEEETERDLNL